MSESPLTIAAVVGSLRASSFNRAVMDATGEVLGDRASLVEAPLAAVPLFNEDIEAAGEPEPVLAMKAAVAAADGLIIFTPEYNRSVPAVTKNAVDWLSRPPFRGPIAGLAVGILGASPGPGDLAGARAHLAIAAAGAVGAVHEPSLGIADITSKLTDGVLTDAATRDAISEWIDGFLAFVRSTKAAADQDS